MSTFLSSGGCGDLIYGLPLIKHLGGGTIYLKSSNKYNDSCDMYEAMKDLLESQSFIDAVKPYPSTDFFEYDPNIEIDHDLDKFRKQPNIAEVHIINSYLRAFGVYVPYNLGEPFLEVEPNHPLGDSASYALINLTSRYRDNSIDWSKILADLREKYLDNICFIGLQSEYLDFVNFVGFINFLPTKNLLECAQYIASCDEIYCNQSVCLTIAQGLGVRYNLEVAPAMTNCIMNSENESLLSNERV